MEIKDRLEKLAFKKSIPFCYGCYIDAPTGRCLQCGSDDLMRKIPGIGVEYGASWCVEHLVNENIPVVDIDEIFEQMVTDCYSSTVKVAWLEVDTATAAKELDPVSWDMAKWEYAESLVEDGQLFTFDNGRRYFWIHDIEKYLDESEAE